MGRATKQERDEVAQLFVLAKAATPTLAQRYVQLARKKAQRTRISLKAYNRVHCRKCCAYWSASEVRVRTTSIAVVYTCLRCGEKKRFRKGPRATLRTSSSS